MDRWTLVILAVFVEGGLALAAWLLGWLFGVPTWQAIRWDLDGIVWGLAVTGPMVVGLVAVVRWPVGPLARIKRFSDEVVRPIFAPCTLLELGLICVLAGLGEELFFRALLQTAFSGLWGPWVGGPAAAAIFGLLHMITPTYAVLAAGMGVYLGCAWLATGNLLAVVVAHAAYDFIALVYLVRVADGPVEK